MYHRKVLTGGQRVSKLSILFILFLSFSIFSACERDRGVPSSRETEKTSELSCEVGQFLNEDQERIYLSLHSSFENRLENFYSKATAPAHQSVLNTSSGEYYVRSRPGQLFLYLNGELLDRTSLKNQSFGPVALFEGENGLVYLAVGTSKALKLYLVNQELTEMATLSQLGPVSKISAAHGNICLISNDGYTSLRTSPDELRRQTCSQVLYDASALQESNQKLPLATHVAAGPEGCYLVTRTGPSLGNHPDAQHDFVMDLVDFNTSEFMDLREIRDTLFYFDKEGKRSIIKADLGDNFSKTIYSDLDSSSKGIVATATGFNSSNWDRFSSIDFFATPNYKFLYGLKLLSEIRGGLLFLDKDKIVRKEILMEENITPIEMTPAGGTVSIKALPHESFPLFSSSGIENNQLVLKTYLGIFNYDLTNYQDTSIASLPRSFRSTWVDPAYPTGLVYDIALSKNRLFTTVDSKQIHTSEGVSVTNLYVYDIQNTPGQILEDQNLSPQSLKSNQIDLLGATPRGFIGHDNALPSGEGTFFQPYEEGQKRVFFKPGSELEMIPGVLGSISLTGLPVIDNNNGQAAWVFYNIASQGIGIEVYNDGELTASSSELSTIFDPKSFPFTHIGSLYENLLVIGNETQSGNSELHAYLVEDGNVTLLPHFGSAQFHVHPGKIKGLKGLKQNEDGSYSVVLLWEDEIQQVTFAINNLEVTEVLSVETLAAPSLVDVVFNEDDAYLISKSGPVAKFSRSNFTLPAEPLGMVSGEDNNWILEGQCHYYAENIYCSGLFSQTSRSVFQFDIKNKQGHQIPNHYTAISFLGGNRLILGEDYGSGISIFSLL